MQFPQEKSLQGSPWSQGSAAACRGYNPECCDLQTVAHSQQAVQEEFHSLRLPNSPRGLSVWYSRSKGRQHRGYHEGALVGHFRAGCSQTSEFSNELRVSTMAFHDAPELIHLKADWKQNMVKSQNGLISYLSILLVSISGSLWDCAIHSTQVWQGCVYQISWACLALGVHNSFCRCTRLSVPHCLLSLVSQICSAFVFQVQLWCMGPWLSILP